MRRCPQIAGPAALVPNVPKWRVEGCVIALKSILVATDFSKPADTALRYGKDLARTYAASLHVLNVADDLGARIAAAPMAIMPDIGYLQSELEEDARRAVAALLTDEDRRVLRAQPVVLTASRPADAILSVRARREGRPHRDRHARADGHGAPGHGQCRGARRARGAVSCADRQVSGTGIRSARRPPSHGAAGLTPGSGICPRAMT